MARIVTMGILRSSVVDTRPSFEVETIKYTALSVWFNQRPPLLVYEERRRALTTTRNRGESLLDRPSFETSSSALDEKSTRSVAVPYQYRSGEKTDMRSPDSRDIPAAFLSISP